MLDATEKTEAINHCARAESHSFNLHASRFGALSNQPMLVTAAPGSRRRRPWKDSEVSQRHMTNR